MGLIKLFLLSTVVILSLSSIAIAQEDHRDHHANGEKIGKISFATSCSPQARRQFNRAVAWLHSFEYDESQRAFIEVAAIDPQCGMAHWGRAMSQYHQLWAPPTRSELQQGAEAAQKAKQIGAKTKRERDYIDAIARFYEGWDKLDHQTRAANYERAMKQLYLRYPGDREAGIFYALAMNATALAATPMDKSYAKQKNAAVILNRALRAEPEHPGVTHYLIHSYDYPPLAKFALSAARSYAKIAPSSAHALHMPSHIFIRLGLWQEAISSNIAAEAAAKDYATKNHVVGAWDEQLHAMDYLEYAYLQGARDREAKQVLDELVSIKKTDPENFKCAYSFAAIPARYALERRRWAEAAHLTLRPNFPWQQFRWAEAITYFASALGAARIGDVASAKLSVDKLTEIQTALVGAKDNYDWSTQVEIQRRAAAAWLAHARGEDEEALRLMRSAADLEDSTDKHPVTPGPVLPAREMLGDLLIELKQPLKALKEYEASLKESPNRFNGLYGAASAAELAGDVGKAAAFFRNVTAMCPRGDAEREELRHAKAFLAKR